MTTSTLPARRRAATVLGAVLLGGAVVTGCGSASEEVSERIAERAGGGDVEIDGDDVTITGADGSVVSTSSKLPDDFPVDDVPLVDLPILSAASVEDPSGRGFVVSMTSDESASDVGSEIEQLLDDAGFTDVDSSAVGQMSFRQFTGNGWMVSVTVAESDETAVQYLVSPATE